MHSNKEGARVGDDERERGLLPLGFVADVDACFDLWETLGLVGAGSVACLAIAWSTSFWMSCLTFC